MENGKAVEPHGIPIDIWKCLGERDISQLTKLFNEIIRSKKISEEWRINILIPL